MTLEQLKSKAYDLIVFINQAQEELRQVNQLIQKELEKEPKETGSIKEEKK